MDDRLDDRLKELAGEYNEPPETPREEMWAAIQARRLAEGNEPEKAERTETERGILPFRPFRSFRSFRLVAGIAALLALGIGLGRLTIQRPQAAPAPAVAVAVVAPKVNAAAYRVATTDYLSQSEEFLTLFRASVRGRQDPRLASATARQLLATNRLLLDSPAADDQSTRLLLQDLELVLAEIAQLSVSSESHERNLITENLEQGGVMSRLRTAVPAGASPTRGAL